MDSSYCSALPGQKPDFDADVKVALDRSRPVLLAKLAKAHGGELALLCLAAVHDAVPRDDKVLVKAMKKLSRIKLSRTYDLSLRLMVASEYLWLPNRQKLAVADQRKLLRNISRDGGFDYNHVSKRWDLSNSQYGALGLRAAAAMGGEIPKNVWEGLIRSTFTAQGEEGGFSYMTGGRRESASMTAAGIVVARISADHLDAALVKQLDVERRLARAWEYLVEHKGEIGDRDTKNSFYFHYGLERACILSDVKDVDGKDWYRSGGEMLLRTQLARGGWRSKVDHIQGGPDTDGSDSVSTSFAILFLRRKFEKHVKPITPRSSVSIGRLSDQSTPDQIARVVQATVARGRAAMPAVLRGLRNTVKARRIAAAKALFAITGQDFGFNPHVPPERSRAAATKAELWWLKSKGQPPKVGKNPDQP